MTVGFAQVPVVKLSWHILILNWLKYITNFYKYGIQQWINVILQKDKMTVSKMSVRDIFTKKRILNSLFNQVLRDIEQNIFRKRIFQTINYF